MAQRFYVYLLASGPCGHLYVGVTNDIVRRVAEHKSGLIPGYTADRGIDQLVWYETHRYIDQAILREKRIKRWLREWKFAWVEKDNPRWLDLYGEVRAKAEPGSAEPTGPG
jgi:Predicted endonuclease containing a URI domain